MANPSPPSSGLLFISCISPWAFTVAVGLLVAAVTALDEVKQSPLERLEKWEQTFFYLNFFCPI